MVLQAGTIMISTRLAAVGGILSEKAEHAVKAEPGWKARPEACRSAPPISPRSFDLLPFSPLLENLMRTTSITKPIPISGGSAVYLHCVGRMWDGVGKWVGGGFV
jgi:hypothetical protein